MRYDKIVGKMSLCLLSLDDLTCEGNDADVFCADKSGKPDKKPESVIHWIEALQQA